jgi:membrane-bound ClpP family serine protease
MGTLPRYVLFQLPGWALAALAAAALVRWDVVDATVAGGLFALWVVKDFALYPLVRHAYGPGGTGGATDLVGREAVACGDLAPGGFVRVRGELWQAELLAGETWIARGDRVEIRGVDGRVLQVARRPQENMR